MGNQRKRNTHLDYDVLYTLPDGTKCYFTDKLVFIGRDQAVMNFPTPNYHLYLEEQYERGEIKSPEDEFEKTQQEFYNSKDFNPEEGLEELSNNFENRQLSNNKPSPKKSSIESVSTTLLEVMLKRYEKREDYEKCAEILEELDRRKNEEDSNN